MTEEAKSIVLSKRDYRDLSTFMYKEYFKEYSSGGSSCVFWVLPRMDDPGVEPSPLLRTVNNMLLDEGFKPNDVVIFSLQPL